MAAERGVYVDQSQSFNVFVAQPDYAKLTSLHFHGWRRGLKTGMYYLRTKPAAQAIQFTVEKDLPARTNSSDSSDSSDPSDPSDPSDGSQTFGEVCASCSG